MTRPFCVCVPARNEAAAIPILIAALASQDVAGPVPIALCVNNSDDGTAAIALAAAAASGGRVALMIEEPVFPAPLAHAGSARRAAMEMGARAFSDPGALLLSTDADCRPPENWVSANLAVAADDRIVGGFIEVDDAGDASPHFIAMCQRIDSYWAAVRAIEDAIDPVPWDPAPRHGDHTGASLALTTGLYRAAGGVPLVPTNEDRGLVEAAIAAGGHLVHPLSVRTRASARVEGRAMGGMAVEMRKLADNIAAGIVAHVPDYSHWRARAEWRRRMRITCDAAALAQAERALPPMPHDMELPDFSALQPEAA